ncbi:MAG: DUF4255 domain-containing protein [Anaerolineales bacterium]|nr:DUF4255 domain-containing protein [Anaerolineales bacterium]
MSSSLAIAAVTATLRDLLDGKLGDEFNNFYVSTQPPDKVDKNRILVNLFLYHTMVDAHWRNMDIPWKSRPGETAQPPLALKLYYLLTAYYGESEDGVVPNNPQNQLQGSHRLLGQAMSILHDHALLDMDTIRNAIPAEERDNHVYDQVERVRITPHPLSLDEMSKIWTGLQTQYRLSVAYEVSAILIDSSRPPHRALPVLRRGSRDQGVGTILGPFPILEDIRRPRGERPGVQLGDRLEIVGSNLGGDVVKVRFYHSLLPDAADLDPEPNSSATMLSVKLPDDEGIQRDWAAGFYRVAVVVRNQGGGADKISNQLPVALSPRIAIQPNLAIVDNEGRVTLTTDCRPHVLPRQHARLLIGDREIYAERFEEAAGSLTFAIGHAPLGEFVVRLRVDGVDSLPVRQTRDGLIFDPLQKVRINGQ